MSLYDANGILWVSQPGDSISPDLMRAVGGMNITPVNVTFESPDPLDTSSVSTLQDLVTAIQAAFRFPQDDGTIYENPSVSVNPANTDDDRIPDGAIVIRGQPERAFGITALLFRR